MNSKREAVSQALFSLLSAANWGTAAAPQQFTTMSRQAQIPSKVAPGDQPAFFLLKLEEEINEAQAFGPPKYLMKYKALIYFRNPNDPQTVNEIQANAILDAIDTAMLSSGSPQALGNLVINAWIDGRTYIETGIIDQQCWIEVPISVLTFI